MFDVHCFIQTFQWYYETSNTLYPDKDFDQIFQDSMIDDTKTAIATNSFLNFVAKIFESYVESYPVFDYKEIIKQEKKLRKDLSLRDKTMEKILISSDLKKAHIVNETRSISEKLDEQLKSDLTSIENDLICSFKKTERKSVDKDLLDAYRRRMRKSG